MDKVKWLLYPICKINHLYFYLREKQNLIGKSIFLGCIGELERRDVSSNAQELQPPVDSAGLISTIRSKSVHRDTKIDLPFQMYWHPGRGRYLPP